MGVATSSASITWVTRSNAPSSQNFYCLWAAKLRNKLGSFLYAARRLFVEEGRVNCPATVISLASLATPRRGGPLMNGSEKQKPVLRLGDPRDLESIVAFIEEMSGEQM